MMSVTVGAALVHLCLESKRNMLTESWYKKETVARYSNWPWRGHKSMSSGSELPEVQAAGNVSKACVILGARLCSRVYMFCLPSGCGVYSSDLSSFLYEVMLDV